MTAIFPSTRGSTVGYFAFTQSTPSAVWVVVHGLGFHPTVQVFDTANDEVEGDIVHDSVDQLTITFSAPFGGVAYLN
jgi:hypothetical protein